MYNIPTSVNTSNKQNNIKLLVLLITLILLIPVVIIATKVKLFNTHGHSMEPLIKDNSYVICIKSNSIERGDIIAFNANGDIAIKRVISLSNETIDIKEDGRVYIGTELLKENYASNPTIGKYEIRLPHKVSPNSVFVLGDNRENSLDSRHLKVGDIKLDEIICEVKLVL